MLISSAKAILYLPGASRNVHHVFPATAVFLRRQVNSTFGASTGTTALRPRHLSSSFILFSRRRFRNKPEAEPPIEDHDLTAGSLENLIRSEDGGLRPITCKQLLETGQIGQEVRIQGWVRGLRKLKNVYFLDINDGSTFNRIPIVLDASKKPTTLTLLSSVDIRGELVQNPKRPGSLELHPTGPVHVLGVCNQQEYPMRGKWEAKYDAEHIRHYFHLRFKMSKFESMMRLRSHASRAINDYFNENGFFQIHTPILTSNDCEGAGELFTLKPANAETTKEITKSTDSKQQTGQNPDIMFFDEQVYLSVSGQLHLEAVTGGLEKVWTFSPIFRAENQQSTRHLSEFYMVESEIAFMYQIEQLLQIMEELIKFCVRRIIFDNCAEFDYYCDDKSEQRPFLESLLKKPFTIMTFEEARNILAAKDNSTVPEGKGLSRDQELTLVELNGDVPIFVINWPGHIKPFYMRQCSDNSSNVSAVDLLVPRIGELCGGSLREHRLHILESKLNALDPTGKLKHSLEWYLDLRRFGSVPTAGFGLGFDRLLQLLLGCGNIKDVCPFPRWPHNCPM